MLPPSRSEGAPALVAVTVDCTTHSCLSLFCSQASFAFLLLVTLGWSANHVTSPHPSTTQRDTTPARLLGIFPGMLPLDDAKDTTCFWS